MGDLNRRMATAARQAVHNRNYRRARDRAMTKLAHLYPDTYKQLLGIEKAIDEQEGKNWLDLSGPVGVLLVPAHHTGNLPVPKPIVKKTTMEEKRENIRVSKRYAYLIHGWGRKQQACLVTLWSRESRFDQQADNPRSSAFGIAQLLRERKSDPREQIISGLKYIAHRYSTPCNALNFHNRHYWY